MSTPVAATDRGGANASEVGRLITQLSRLDPSAWTQVAWRRRAEAQADDDQVTVALNEAFVAIYLTTLRATVHQGSEFAARALAAADGAAKMLAMHDQLRPGLAAEPYEPFAATVPAASVGVDLGTSVPKSDPGGARVKLEAAPMGRNIPAMARFADALTRLTSAEWHDVVAVIDGWVVSGKLKRPPSGDRVDTVWRAVLDAEEAAGVSVTDDARRAAVWGAVTELAERYDSKLHKFPLAYAAFLEAIPLELVTDSTTGVASHAAGPAAHLRHRLADLSADEYRAIVATAETSGGDPKEIKRARAAASAAVLSIGRGARLEAESVAVAALGHWGELGRRQREAIVKAAGDAGLALVAGDRLSVADRDLLCRPLEALVSP